MKLSRTPAPARQYARYTFWLKLAAIVALVIMSIIGYADSALLDLIRIIVL